MLRSVDFACKYSDGIKLQLLHILKGTDLLKDYEDSKFNALTMEQYIDILCDAVSIIPKNVIIHRLTGDGAKSVTAKTAKVPTYALTVSKTGTGTGVVSSTPTGINCGTDCTETYNQNTSVTLTAIPDAITPLAVGQAHARVQAQLVLLV